MWIFPRSAFFPSPPVGAALTSGSKPLSEDSADLLATSLTWRSKPMLARSWLRAWKKNVWLWRLSGRIFDPSMGEISVGLWIWSLRATRVSPSPLLEREPEVMMNDIFGPTSPESSASASPYLCSWRTSGDTYGLDSEKSRTNFKKWVTELRRACLLRRKSGRRTGGSGSSSWPSPRSVDSSRGAGESGKREGGPSTPTSRDHKDGACAEADVLTNGLLGRQAVRWQTPSVTDSIGRDYTYPAGDHSKPFATLTGQAGGTKFHSPLVQTTQKAGEPTSTNSRVLNPQFVEALMGWPIGWTDFGSWGME